MPEPRHAGPARHHPRHDRRARRASQVLGALAAPVLVVAGLALWNHGAQPSQDGTAGPAQSRASAVSSPAARTRASSGAATRRARGRHVDVRPIRPSIVAIPSLGVRAAVQPIRVVDRVLTPPEDPQQLGWWRDGARPGETEGTALLTGHTVHVGGGALDDLEDISIGDVIRVGDGDERVSYAVRSVRVLSTEAVAARHRQLFRQRGPHRLLVVTCEDWDGETYLSSVVVVATPAP